MPSFFCWHELKAPDRKAAKSFYGGLFGWTFTDQDMGPAGVYTDIAVGARHIGGVCDATPGAPPSWISYVTTDDVDAAANRASRAGGKVLMPGTDIPKIGRFAVISDTQGAVFCLWKGQQPETPDGALTPGAFCWNELVAPDIGKAKAFYGEVLGWSFRDVPMPGSGNYTLVQSEGQELGGMFPKPPGAPGPAAWIGYVHTNDVDASSARVKKLGGNLWVEPTDIPNIGRFSVCADPAGATFALYKPLAKAK
jgi:predicted enzyme related to lactoylglutathione lyase